MDLGKAIIHVLAGQECVEHFARYPTYVPQLARLRPTSTQPGHTTIVSIHPLHMYPGFDQATYTAHGSSCTRPITMQNMQEADSNHSQ